jgi:hypothetical protein
MRKPRNAQDRPPRQHSLIGFAYFAIGIAQTMSGFFTFFMVLSIELGLHPSELIGSEHGASATSYGFSGRVPFDMWLGSRFVPRESASLALSRGQSSLSAVDRLVQWIDLLICKTRKLSLFQQGMRNIVLWARPVVETVVAVLPDLRAVLPHDFQHGRPASDLLAFLPLPFMLLDLCLRRGSQNADSPRDVSERACLPKQFELKRQTSFFSSRGVRAISIQTAAIASMMIVVDASAAGRRTRRPTPPRPATDASRSLQSVRDRRICPWHASLRLAAQHTCAPLRGNGFGTPRAFVAKRRVWCHSGVDAGGLAVADA